MSLFNFDQAEALSFFAVLVRFSVLFAVLPFLGDRFVPMPLKILLSLAASIVIFPMLVARGWVRPEEAQVWGATTSGIAGTIALEVLFGLILGFTGKLVFDGIFFGGNLVGNFMGFASASTYDPHQESQTQVVAEFQMAIAMLVFLALDGHHLMVRAIVDSYRLIGVGGMAAGLNAAFAQKIIQITGYILKVGIEIAAPVAISMFAVNCAFGVMAKAMPQLNILVLSFAASALIGLIVLLLSLPEFQGAAGNVMGRIVEFMEAVTLSLAKGT